MMRPAAARLLGLSALPLLLASCDDAKKFIDPTGKAYNTPGDTSKKAETPPSAQIPPPAEAPPPVPVPSAPAAPAARPTPTQRDAPPLTAHAALEQVADMLLASPEGWIPFSKGRALSRGRHYSLWNEREVPWGLAISDLDQDGADDAILAVRSVKGRDTAWTLAVMMDRSGKLQCIQAVPMAIQGLANMESTQGGVLVTPAEGDPKLYGWVGGELRGND
jgi:hypothetical protein